MTTKRRTGSPAGSPARDSRSLTELLKARFESHSHRHHGVAWEDVVARLNENKLATLANMEASGGEPDVVLIEGPRVLLFVDCCAQSPEGRRSLCFDRAAWLERKSARPSSNVVDTAAAIGIELLTEADYRALQALDEFDTTTSSWIATPADIRAAGGALFGDRRFGHVFVYHNGAQSYYAARGFRGKLRL